MATASKKPLNPYNANDIAGAQAVIESGKQILPLIDKCISCGMEFQPLKDQAIALINWAQGVVDNFQHGTDENV